MNKDIYNMNMSDVIVLHTSGAGSLEVLRVPGGWIYTKVLPVSMTSTFIPEITKQD